MAKKTERILDRAKTNLEENNHEHALRLFNEILNREPGHLQALRSKALIKISSGKKDEAEEFLLFAIEQQPQDDQLYQMLGTFYLNNNLPNKAVEQFARATEINDTNSIAHHGLGLLYAQVHGEHQKAIAHFSKTIEQLGTSADAYFNRGCSYMIIQNMTKAEADLRKAVDMDHSKAEEMLQKYFNG